eukprot:TRINITY_DN3674_c0_g1_i1.p1 TRINITY_DN3674_c0_g1~~TRINITY_DN3674_c0_g1_i1.p1  ORF type:complete len:265 (-),score=47.35 TRINITY_DN3674_c0_g1_i1:165-851(-)
MSDGGLVLIMFALYDFNLIRTGFYFDVPDKIGKLCDAMRAQCIPFFYEFIKRKLHVKKSIKHGRFRIDLPGFPKKPKIQRVEVYLRETRSKTPLYPTLIHYYPLPGDILSWDFQRLLWIAKLKPNQNCFISNLPSEILKKIITTTKYNLYDFIVNVSKPWPLPNSAEKFKDKHSFETKMLGQPHWCQSCGSHIKSWGLKKHCVCKLCGMIVHDKCVDTVVASCYNTTE